MHRTREARGAVRSEGLRKEAALRRGGAGFHHEHLSTRRDQHEVPALVVQCDEAAAGEVRFRFGLLSWLPEKSGSGRAHGNEGDLAFSSEGGEP